MTPAPGGGIDVLMVAAPGGGVEVLAAAAPGSGVSVLAAAAPSGSVRVLMAAAHGGSVGAAGVAPAPGGNAHHRAQAARRNAQLNMAAAAVGVIAPPLSSQMQMLSKFVGDVVLTWVGW